MQGSGDETAAKECLSEIYSGCEINVRTTGAPVDIDSGPDLKHRQGSVVSIITLPSC